MQYFVQMCAKIFEAVHSSVGITSVLMQVKLFGMKFYKINLVFCVFFSQQHQRWTSNDLALISGNSDVKVWWQQNNAVSSANRRWYSSIYKLFIYNPKYKCPGTKPCETPQHTFPNFDSQGFDYTINNSKVFPMSEIWLN